MSEKPVSSPQKAKTEPKKKTNYLVIGLITLLGVILFGSLLGAMRHNNQEEMSSISGVLQYSGLTPTEKSEQITQIVLMQREVGTENFVATDANVPVTDNANWVWNGAVAGKSYEMRADLKLGDDFVKSSNTIKTTAPADSQVLDMNVTIKDLPDQILEESEVTLSGMTEINGYIPAGSTINVSQREIDTDTFNTIVESAHATSQVNWSWDTATLGTEYEVQSTLLSNGVVIGESAIVQTTAPSSSVDLNINSTATPPPTTAEISGTVQINGNIEDNSTVLMLQKLPGQAEYSEFQRIPAMNGAAFKWTSASAGQNYEITAALQVNDQNTATGNVLEVVAPAQHEVIVINTGLSLNPPNSAPRNECGSKDSTDHWDASMIFPKVEGALQYRIRVGSEPGQNDIDAGTYPAPQDDLIKDLYAQNGKQYYASYAYSLCNTCGDSADSWSGYSPTLGFVCK